MQITVCSSRKLIEKAFSFSETGLMNEVMTQLDFKKKLHDEIEMLTKLLKPCYVSLLVMSLVSKHFYGHSWTFTKFRMTYSFPRS